MNRPRRKKSSDQKLVPICNMTMSETRSQIGALASQIVQSYDTVGGLNRIDGKNLPSRERVYGILKDLLTLCFPGYFGAEPLVTKNVAFYVDGLVDAIYIRLREEVTRSLMHDAQCKGKDPVACEEIADRIALELLEAVPGIRKLLMGDVEAAYDGDPAARSHDEIILSYPCVEAIATHRIAHELYLRKTPLIPRIMSEHAHSRTGIDIHPGANIGTRFFIDHGTGVVIGETALIGENVKLYQGVTLGALSFRKDEGGRLVKGGKRHPTIEDDVVIYSGATILGGETTIGHDSVIGANVWLTEPVPPHSKVTIGTPRLDVVKHDARTA